MRKAQVSQPHTEQTRLDLQTFTRTLGNLQGNRLWHALMDKLRPDDLPDEEDFQTQLKQELEMMKRAGTSRRDRHYYKSVRCAGYLPGPPGEPSLIKAVDGQYLFAHWITREGLSRLLDTVEQQPTTGHGLGIKSIRLLRQLTQETSDPTPEA